MQASTVKLLVGVFFLIIVLSAIAIGANLALKQQKTETSAAVPRLSLEEVSKGSALSKPRIGDFNGDGEINGVDESLFMLKYRAKDRVADLDNSGQVNTLDLALFRNLTQGEK